MNFKYTEQQIVDETIAKTKKLEIEIGEGRILDDGLLQQIKEIALSSTAFAPGEQEFFLNILKQPDLHKLEDWPLIKFIRIAEKVNVKITLLGKPNLNAVSTEETRNELIKKLRERYTRGERTILRHVFEDKSTSQDISEAYVNLAIVMNQKQDGEDKNDPESYQDNRMKNSYEHIFGKKEDYPISQILSPFKTDERGQSEQYPSKILIEGWAGIGKTVLCQYLTVMWARDTQEKEKRWWLEDTKVVIYIRLRNLTNYDDKNCFLGEMVRRECFGIKDFKDTNYPSAAQIEVDLETLGEKVLLLLDGFDEVADWYQKYTDGSNQTLTVKSEFLNYVLLGNRHGHRIILTSRPSRIEQIEQIFDRRLETIGFKDKDIKRYISNYFYNESKDGALLLENMRRNVNFWGIAHIPVNLGLICLVWKESEKKYNKDNKDKSIVFSMMTMTELYSNTVLWLLRRDWMKHPVDDNGSSILFEHLTEKVLLQNVDSIKIERFENTLHQYPMKLNFLRELAWNAQTSPNLDILVPGGEVLKVLNKHFPELNWPVQQMKKLLDIKSLGLLETQIGLEEVSIEQNSFYFPHLTFQEYFAAKYWVKMYCSDIEKNNKEAIKQFKKYKYFPRFLVVWWFVSGLLQDLSKDHLRRFFDLVQNEPRELTGIRHISLLSRCLEESKIAFSTDNNQYCQELSEIDQAIRRIIELLANMLKNESYYDVYDVFEFYRAFRDSMQQCPQLYFQSKIINLSGDQISKVKPIPNQLNYEIDAIFLFLSYVRLMDTVLFEELLRMVYFYLTQRELTIDQIKGFARFFILSLNNDIQDKWVMFYIDTLKKYIDKNDEKHIDIIVIQTMRTFPISDLSLKNQMSCVINLETILENNWDHVNLWIEAFKTLCRYLTQNLLDATLGKCINVIVSTLKIKYEHIINNFCLLGPDPYVSSDDRFFSWQRNSYSQHLFYKNSQELRVYCNAHSLKKLNQCIIDENWNGLFGEIERLSLIEQHKILLILLGGEKSKYIENTNRNNFNYPVYSNSESPSHNMRGSLKSSGPNLFRWINRNTPNRIHERNLEELSSQIQNDCCSDLIEEADMHPDKWLYMECISRIAMDHWDSFDIEKYAEWLFKNVIDESINDNIKHSAIRSIFRIRLSRSLSISQLDIFNTTITRLMKTLVSGQYSRYKYLQFNKTFELIKFISLKFNIYYPSFEKKREFLKSIPDEVIIDCLNKNDIKTDSNHIFEFFSFYCIFNRRIVYLKEDSKTIVYISQSGNKEKIVNERLVGFIKSKNFQRILDNIWSASDVVIKQSSVLLSQSPDGFHSKRNRGVQEVESKSCVIL